MISVPYPHTSVNLNEVDILNLPHSKKQSTSDIYSSACPFCQDGQDRFTFWLVDGNYFCRRCDARGHINSIQTVTQDMRDKWEKNRQTEREKRKKVNLSAIEKLQQEKKHVPYHLNLNGHSSTITNKWGIDSTHINIFELGYCQACPTLPLSPSITIPYFWDNNIISIRHRLLNSESKGKYRPEIAGLPAALYNADLLRDKNEDFIILVEGEFKAMVLLQFGFPAVAVPGANIFKPQWANLFKGKKKVYIAFDPGAEQQAKKTGDLLASTTNCFISSLPFKPDDMLIKYGYTQSQFSTFIEQGRPI